MERHFTLPLGFAAALHAALLFGFTKPIRITPAIDPRPPYVPFELSRPEPESLPEPEITSARPEPTLPPERPVIASPEPLVVDPGTVLTMPRPVIDATSQLDTRTLPDWPPAARARSGDGVGDGKIIPDDQLDNPPRTRLQPAPIYPFEGKREGVRGEVLIEFRVDESGRVHDPRVVRSSHRMFEEPTLRAVSRWQFEPGRRNGRVVSFRMAVPVLFHLGD